MKNICVITGGGSGIGFAAAKVMGDDCSVLISGRSIDKLKRSKEELTALGIDAEIFSCDVSNRESVKELAGQASKMGKVVTVIHSAGISPHMGTLENILDINAIGTIYINEEFAKIMDKGGCIIDVSSMSAYLLSSILPDKDVRKDYPLCLTHIDKFKQTMMDLSYSLGDNLAVQIAYSLSKDFIIWYAAYCACAFGKNGIRVLSVSPGTFDTEMGRLEGDQATAFAVRGALGRVGQPEEIANLLKFAASDAVSYLTGTDILCDGGAVASMKNMQKHLSQ